MGQRSRRRDRAPAAPETPSGPPVPRDRMAERYARGRARDADARASLEPLDRDERPAALTVASIVAALLAIANIVAVFVVEGHRGQLGFSIVQSVILLVAAAGMWRAKYWAVLGFECLLALQILVLALALLVVERVVVGLVVAAIIAALGYLFYKLIRVMARVQMPQRGPRDAAG